MKPLMSLPCKNRHTDMEKRGSGYHCNSCDHVLTDFRNSSEAEINAAIKANPGKICGVFNPHQFDYKVSHLQIPALKAVGFSLLGILGFLGPVVMTSCESDPAANGKKQDAFNLLKFPMHIKGTLTDEKGHVLRNFKLQVLQHNQVVKTGTTDKFGNFDIVIQKGDLDQETFDMVFGKAMVVNDTLPMKLGKFGSGKKVKLTIKAEAIEVIETVGEMAVMDNSCNAVEGIMVDEPPLAGIPAPAFVEAPKEEPLPDPEVVQPVEGKMIIQEEEEEEEPQPKKRRQRRNSK